VRRPPPALGKKKSRPAARLLRDGAAQDVDPLELELEQARMQRRRLEGRGHFLSGRPAANKVAPAEMQVRATGWCELSFGGNINASA
jgi:hypothetical protein